jgi:hypothetical protein
MKKPQKILTTIISLIMLTLFVGSAQAQVCTGSYVIDDIDTNGDITALSGCTEITGTLTIEITTLTSLTGLENITSVGSDLLIIANYPLTSLTGLENLTSVGGKLVIVANHSLPSLTGLEKITSVYNLSISNNYILTNLCALYNLLLTGITLEISYNDGLSIDTANALKAQLIVNGFTGTATIFNNNGSGLVSCDIDTDNDNDGIPNATDNCPNTFNAEQLDADSDTIGDLCDGTSGCLDGGGCGQSACEQTLTVKVEELLTHYYWNILGRAPDSGGLAYWQM